MTERRGRVSEFRPRRFRRYPDYRDSGVEWLGEIPAHWEIRRADRRLTSLKHPVVPSEIRGQDVFHYSIPNVQQFGSGVIEPTATIDSSKTAIDRPVLLVSKLNPRKGTLALAKPHPALMTLASSEFIVMEPKGCVLEFARYFYRSEHVRLALSARVESATRSHQRCSPDDISKLPVSWPSKPEQTTIATFLDRETAKIDALVEKKERLIELLQEKRTALITSAVTRGLDTSVPMQDSGIEWLGEIPAHWEMKPLSYKLERITYGFTNPMPTADEGPYMLTALDIGDGQILYENARRTTNDAFERDLTDKSRPRGGDLLLTKDGTLGRVAVADGRRVAINQSIALLRFDRSVHVRFMQHLLLAAPYQDRMAFEAGGTTIKHIYISRLARMPIGIPPKQDQKVISDFVGQEKTKADILIAKVHQAIDHLKEYRTALISAAVTGKIDVRKDAA